MSVLGLIVEYNPFHNGHLYHFNTSLSITQADYSICVMSGNFVQRGEPALIDKWSRAQMALDAGIDLCIELPVIYCVQSAEIFAYGAVSILNSLGIVDYLCFGSESGDIDLLKNVASIISDEPLEYKNFLKEEVAKGNSFPVSRANAVMKYLGKSDAENSEIHEVKPMLMSSNNILGLEYIKWIYRLKSKIAPVTIKRMHSSYNDESTDTPYASALAVRKSIKEGRLHEISHIMPEFAVKIIQHQLSSGKGPIFLDDFTQTILCLLRRMTTEEISKIMDVNEGLENRIRKIALSSSNLDELVSGIKSKRYTETRIKRILAHALLGLEKEDLNWFKEAGGPQYIRVLGFSDKGRHLISAINSLCPLPVITNVSDYRQYDNPCLKKMIELDIMATDIYATSYHDSKLRMGGYDFYKRPLFPHLLDK